MKRAILLKLVCRVILFSITASFCVHADPTVLRPLPRDLQCPDDLFEAGRCKRYVELDWLEQAQNARISVKPLPDETSSVPADTVKVYARMRYWHDFRYSLPWFRIHVESLGAQGYRTHYATHIGNIHWMDWEHDLVAPDDDGNLRIIPSKTRLIQAPDVPLAPGVLNRISLEVLVDDAWHRIRETSVRISPDLKVVPVRIHYLHYGSQWDFREGAKGGHPFIGFEKIFDRSQVPHCTSPSECATRASCEFEKTNYPPESAGRMQCGLDFQCSGVCEDKTRCFYTAWGWVCHVPRVCLSGSCYHNWSVDEYFSPLVAPSAEDPGYEYNSCGILFTADGNPADGYNPRNSIHVIDLADESTYRFLQERFVEITSPEDVRHAFNCGAEKLRKYAVEIAERDGAMQAGDGMMHAFLTRSLARTVFDCRMDNPSGENCSEFNASGITARVDMPDAAYFFLALEPECRFNETTGPGASRRPYALAAAHEIGHVGFLGHACNDNAKDSPRWGNLMCPPDLLQNPEVSDPYLRQNFHMFAGPGGVDQCQLWKQGAERFNLIDLNAR